MQVSEFIIAEGNLCVVAAFMGMMLGFEYDIIRVFRRVIIHKRVWTMSIEDIVYWIIAAFQVFGLIYEHGSGVVRAFLVIMMMCGVWIYRRGIGKYLVVYVSKMLNFLFKPLKKMMGSVTMFTRNKYVTIKQARCKKKTKKQVAKQARKETSAKLKKQRRQAAKNRSREDEAGIKKRKGDAI